MVRLLKFLGMNNKAKLFKTLRRNSSEFNKVVHNVLERYEGLSNQYFEKNDDFFEKIRLEQNFFDDVEAKKIKKIEEEYKKVLQAQQNQLIDEGVLDFESWTAELSEIDTLLSEKTS